MDPHILIVDDSTDDAELARWSMSRAGMLFTSSLVWSETEMIAELTRVPDLIISDFEIPGFDGWGALRVARELVPAVPFIFHSGTIGRERWQKALSLGVFGCVEKDHADVFVNVVRNALKAA
jgi:CheY-like chemotaxis protein